MYFFLYALSNLSWIGKRYDQSGTSCILHYILKSILLIILLKNIKIQQKIDWFNNMKFLKYICSFFFKLNLLKSQSNSVCITISSNKSMLVTQTIIIKYEIFLITQLNIIISLKQ